MNSPTAPPLVQTQRRRQDWHTKLLLGLALAVGIPVGALMILRLTGLVHPFSVPTGAMAPAISPGDHILMEGMSYLRHNPRRGDNVVFQTDGIASLPPAQIHVKRVAGLPGDHLRISDGHLFVNDKPVNLSNACGEILYFLPPGSPNFSPQTNVIVPNGSYFVLGDNSTNSFDSRFWGSVPRANILGRVSLCYWPPRRAGKIK